MKIRISSLLVTAMVLVACSSTSGEVTTTNAAGPVTTDGATTTSVPTATTTTTTVSTTTTTLEQVVDPDTSVMAKTTAIEEALPDDWTATTAAQEEFNSGDDFVYEACQTPDEFDLNDLDSVTVAALVTTVEGPEANPPFPGATGSVEARAFENEAAAEHAFAVFERLYGTEEGLQCLTGVVQATMGDEVPTDQLTFEVESVTVAGSQAGARIVMSFDIEGFAGSVFVEFQGARQGSCTVIASFITFGEPFDRAVADSIFTAAMSA